MGPRDDHEAMEFVAIMPSGNSEDEPQHRRSPQHAAGSPDTQYDRLTEFWALYRGRPDARRFKPGDMVRLDPDPALADLVPYRYPEPGYPAVVLASEPDDVKAGLERFDDHSGIDRFDIIVGIIVAGRSDEGQKLARFPHDSRFLALWPTEVG